MPLELFLPDKKHNQKSLPLIKGHSFSEFPLMFQGLFILLQACNPQKTKIPEHPEEAFKFLYGDVLLSDLPPQALNLFSGKWESEIRQSKAILTYKEIKKSMATAGELSHPDN